MTARSAVGGGRVRMRGRARRARVQAREAAGLWELEGAQRSRWRLVSSCVVAVAGGAGERAEVQALQLVADVRQVSWVSCSMMRMSSTRASRAGRARGCVFAAVMDGAQSSGFQVAPAALDLQQLFVAQLRCPRPIASGRLERRRYCRRMCSRRLRQRGRL